MRHSWVSVLFWFIIAFSSIQLMVQALPFYVICVYELDPTADVPTIEQIKEDIVTKLETVSINDISVKAWTPQVFHDQTS